MPPGWYPDPSTGLPRWWDGYQWGNFAPPPQWNMQAPPQPGTFGPADPASRGSAALAHYLGIFGFLGPLIIMMSSGARDTFIRMHAVEAVNFHITVIIGWVLVGVINVITCGIAFPLFFLIFVPVVIFGIQAGSAANRGEEYRYPWTIRMVT